MARLSESEEKRRWGVSCRSGHIFSTSEVGFPVSSLAGERIAPVRRNQPSAPVRAEPSPYLMASWDERVSLVCTEWIF